VLLVISKASYNIQHKDNTDNINNVRSQAVYLRSFLTNYLNRIHAQIIDKQVGGSILFWYERKNIKSYDFLHITTFPECSETTFNFSKGEAFLALVSHFPQFKKKVAAL